MSGCVSREGRRFASQFSQSAIRVQAGDEAERLALNAERNIPTQLGMIEQALAVAGMFHGSHQVGLQQGINAPRDFRGISDLTRSVVGPEALAEGAGGQRVFERGLAVSAATNQNQVRRQLPPNPVDDGAEVQKGADQNRFGMGAGA